MSLSAVVSSEFVGPVRMCADWNGMFNSPVCRGDKGVCSPGPNGYIDAAFFGDLVCRMYLFPLGSAVDGSTRGCGVIDTKLGAVVPAVVVADPAIEILFDGVATSITMGDEEGLLKDGIAVTSDRTVVIGECTDARSAGELLNFLASGETTKTGCCGSSIVWSIVIGT